MIKEQIPTYSINFNEHACKAALICRSEANLNEKNGMSVNNKREREREREREGMG